MPPHRQRTSILWHREVFSMHMFITNSPCSRTNLSVPALALDILMPDSGASSSSENTGKSLKSYPGRKCCPCWRQNLTKKPSLHWGERWIMHCGSMHSNLDQKQTSSLLEQRFAKQHMSTMKTVGFDRMIIHAAGLRTFNFIANYHQEVKKKVKRFPRTRALSSP